MILKFLITSFIVLFVYYSQINSYVIDDDVMIHQPKMITSTSNQISITVTDVYRDLDTIIMPTEKYVPVEVHYDNDGLSYSKSIYECIEKYDSTEIMKNIKHYKLIIISTDDKSFCILNTELLL